MNFRSSLCYCLGIKQRSPTAFYPQTKNHTQRQKSTIEAYLLAFISFEQNNRARLLLIAEFAYNKAKNTGIGHTYFELNCGYCLHVLYKEDIDPGFKSKSVDKLAVKMRDLITMYRKNLQYAQNLQKRANARATKPKSYVLGNKV